MAKGESVEQCQRRHRENAGKDAYRKFAKAMWEFREAIAEMAETSKPDLKHAGFEQPGARAQRHQKIVTRLRANGYRPLVASTVKKAG